MLFISLWAAEPIPPGIRPDISWENFYVIHGSPGFQPNEIKARRYFGIPDNLPQSSLMDVTAVLNGALGGITPSHALRRHDIKKYKYTYLIPAEAIRHQMIAGVSDDIQVVLDIPLPPGTIIIGPREDFLDLKAQHGNRPLSEIFPNISFKGIQNFHQLTVDELSQKIREICYEKGRYFTQLPKGLNRNSDIGQSLACANPETGQVFCYRAPDYGIPSEQPWARRYAQNPLAETAVELEKTRGRNHITDRTVILQWKEGDTERSCAIGENELINSLLGQDPKTDLEGVFKRYENHLTALFNVIIEPRHVEFFIKTAFEGADIREEITINCEKRGQRTIVREEKYPEIVRGKISQAYLQQIRQDLECIRQELAKVGVEPGIQRTRFEKFMEHQMRNIAFLEQFDFAHSKKLLHFLKMVDSLRKNPEGMSLRDIILQAFQTNPCRGIPDLVFDELLSIFAAGFGIQNPTFRENIMEIKMLKKHVKWLV